MIYQSWWKWVGIVLLIYTIVAGFVVPLKPGIERVSPTQVTAGQQLQLDVKGYNTLWSGSNSNIRAWLKYNEELQLASVDIEVFSDRTLKATFTIPTWIPENDKVNTLSLIIDDPATGPVLLPNAVFVRPVENPDQQDRSAWTVNAIEDIHFKNDFSYPYRNLLAETIRNQYFHVPLWFAMIIMFTFSMVKSIQNLRNFKSWRDQQIIALNTGGVVFGILGLVTGMIWAHYTWGKAWNWDIKQTMALIAVMIYVAYFILRGSVNDRQVRARFSNVYNIFAFTMLIPLLFIIPRMTDSLHPGAGGNPAFGGDDLDNTMRAVFYPAVIGWTILGMWVSSLLARYFVVREKWRLKVT
jgi:heme exporter protein C